ncbi:hypothetical protein [Halomontanus rarus]|uniref:hypothetical protein n=1 Tax=Halomontanus rarus TaxID=3034020 RepID=UPI0023E85788|nr:hypothetical protein [Halovivax sp. TS33]
MTIKYTTSPVAGGERLVATAELTNTASEAVTETIHLTDSSNRVLDSQEHTIPEHSSKTIKLGYTTYNTKVKVTFPLSVSSHHASDSQSVTVVPRNDDAGHSVSLKRTTAPVTGGEFLEAVIALGNSELHDVSDTVELLDSSGNVLDSRTLTLPREATETIALGWDTYPVKNTVTFPLTAKTSVDSESEEVTVYGTK